jgi:transaldolase/glucose-6-phosphate isomerase
MEADSMTNRFKELNNLGQSIWYDNIRRAMLTSGEFQELVDDGILGVTSNPTIFEKAIVGSTDYDESIKMFIEEGSDLDTIYERLVLEDIATTADMLRPVYKETGGLDGYVSVEVRPTLANDTQETIIEAKRLFATLNRPNIMIKVPATPEGVPAIEALIADGININVTLIFSLKHYEAVASAYINGLEKRLASGDNISQVASVASFFISRVDTSVDRALEEIGDNSLKGKIGIANSKSAYARFKKIFSGDRWEKLAAAGARVQRPLWASTGTKNPEYSDTLYLDNLIGPDTVNTVPPATLNAFRDHGQVAPTLEAYLDEAYAQLEQLSKLGIGLEVITQKLQDDGVSAFSNSFEALMRSLHEKEERLKARGEQISFSLGKYQHAVDEALDEVDSERVVKRIWEHDHTLWKPESNEITNRLGWLNIAEVSKKSIPALEGLAANLRAEGHSQALLLGMGGSSLAPEVFLKTFGVREGYLELAVLDSTDPGAISAQVERLDLAKTIFIVSTKSGGTVETLSFFKYFYNRVSTILGAEKAGEHFIAITDEGTRLDEIATRYNFRATYHNDPNIGGRYSALSYFGLVPAALIGVDLDTLLERALSMTPNNDSQNPSADGDNLGARLGVVLGELANAGRNKLTLLTSPEIASFGDWVEQLIAESTGKEGKGILPVVGEQIGNPEHYGDDRLFVYIKLIGDPTYDKKVDALENAGHPIIRLRLTDLYDLGGQFFLWEMATAIAGYRLGINPFDQPNVEAAKVLAREMVTAYQKSGRLPELAATLQTDGISVFVDPTMESANIKSLRQALESFLAEAQPGAYIALQAYIQPTPAADQILQVLRTQLRDSTRLATTLGYGPRFLHSTGQLHKGDTGNGLFIQLTSESLGDIPIPEETGSNDSSISFGVLKLAQALGDRQALLDANRKVLRFHLGSDPAGGIKKLNQI